MITEAEKSREVTEAACRWLAGVETTNAGFPLGVARRFAFEPDQIFSFCQPEQRSLVGQLRSRHAL